MRLRVRDDALRFTGERTFRSADLTVRWNKPSTAVIQIAETQAEGLRRGVGVALDDGHGMVLSGLIVQRSRRDDLDDDVVELTVEDDLHRLQGRLAYPDPSLAADGDQPNRWDMSGAAGEVLAEMVDLNAGAGARSERQIAGLAVDDATGVGETVRARRRFPVVAEEVERLGRQGEVVCRLRQAADTAEIRFTVEPQQDKTRTVVLSEKRGNLSGFEAESELPEATFVVVAGPGEGSDRLIVTREDADAVSAWGRWEAWVDARNTADDDDPEADQIEDLEDRGDDELRDLAAQERIAVDVVETETARWREHWDVGDLVTVEVDGGRLTKTVESVEVSVEPGDGPDGRAAVTATPVLGRESPRSRLRMLSRLGEVEQRVSEQGKV